MVEDVHNAVVSVCILPFEEEKCSTRFYRKYQICIALALFDVQDSTPSSVPSRWAKHCCRLQNACIDVQSHKLPSYVCMISVTSERLDIILVNAVSLEAEISQSFSVAPYLRCWTKSGLDVYISIYT